MVRNGQPSAAQSSAGAEQGCLSSAPAVASVIEKPVFLHRPGRERTVIRLPSYEQVKADPAPYAHANRVLHLETNPGNARALVQLR